MKFLLLFVTLLLVIWQSHADSLRGNCGGDEPTPAPSTASPTTPPPTTPAPTTPAPTTAAPATPTPTPQAVGVEKTEAVDGVNDKDLEAFLNENGVKNEGDLTKPVEDSNPNNDVVAAADWQQQMLNLVNQHRAENDLPPLSMHPTLNEAGQNHAGDMAQQNYFDHTGLDGSSPTQRAHEVGWKGGVGENIAAGQSQVAKVMNEWMNSPGHRANILGDYKTFGCGHAKGQNAQYSDYWVQEFGS